MFDQSWPYNENTNLYLAIFYLFFFFWFSGWIFKTNKGVGSKKGLKENLKSMFEKILE